MIRVQNGEVSKPKPSREGKGYLEISLSISIKAREKQLTFLLQTVSYHYSELFFYSAERLMWLPVSPGYLEPLVGTCFSCLQWFSASDANQSQLGELWIVISQKNVRISRDPARVGRQVSCLGLGGRCLHFTAPGWFQHAIKAENWGRVPELGAVWCLTFFNGVQCTTKKYSSPLTWVPQS